MRIIRHEWYSVKRSDRFTIVPLGDVHLGNRTCDEALFVSVVNRIAQDDTCYWLGMGDYCEFINVRDPRFNVEELAGWISLGDLGDLARVQRDKFLELVKPIASKCLALVEGNHEQVIKRHYERDIYHEIVSGVKEAGGLPAERPLSIGMYGWLLLHFYREKKRKAGARIRINLHHGFVGGKLAGAKALNMQRWLWTHECDVALFGHSHNAAAQVETIEYINRGGKAAYRRAVGAYCGSFIQMPEYAERKGYFPAPTGHIEVILTPCVHDATDRVRVVSG